MLELKIEGQWLDEILAGRKTFELRKLSTKLPKGARLALREFNECQPTGRAAFVEVGECYQPSFGLEPGYMLIEVRNPRLAEAVLCCEEIETEQAHELQRKELVENAVVYNAAFDGLSALISHCAESEALPYVAVEIRNRILETMTKTQGVARNCAAIERNKEPVLQLGAFCGDCEYFNKSERRCMGVTERRTLTMLADSPGEFRCASHCGEFKERKVANV